MKILGEIKHILDMDVEIDPVTHVVHFFGKNRNNLAKGLKATQVHDSDTPARSH